MIKYTIRKSNVNDVQLAFDIRKNALGEYVKQTWGWNEEWQWDFHVKDFDTSILSFVEVEGRGVASIEVSSEKESLLVSGIYIIDEFQSKGIGKMLMEDIMNRAASENKSVRLQVLKVNTRAKQFYERLGFVPIGETEFHFQMIWKNK